MQRIQRLASLAVLAWSLATPALADAVVPIKPLSAPAPARPEGGALLGGQIGTMGVGVYFMNAMNPRLSLGLFASQLSIKLNDDPLTVNEIGARARYHWNGAAPRGGYAFAELVNISPSFDKSKQEAHRTSEILTKGIQPSVGVGYQTLSRGLSWDFGIGLGPLTKFEAHYGPNSESKVAVGGTLYLGIAFGI